MLIMELPVGAKKEKKEVALNNLSAIMDRWAAANIIITTTTKGTNFGNPQTEVEFVNAVTAGGGVKFLPAV